MGATSCVSGIVKPFVEKWKDTLSSVPQSGFALNLLSLSLAVRVHYVFVSGVMISQPIALIQVQKANVRSTLF